MVIRNTIDQSKTGLNHVTFTNAYGFEMAVDTIGGIAPKYSALVFDGSNTNANGLQFDNVNGTNILLVDLANPSITDSTLTLGIDDYSIGKSAALSAYGAGAGISDPFTVSSGTFTGDSEGSCGNNGNGISMIYIENSYAELDLIDITDNGYGIFFQQSSGELTNSDITVNCAAVDTKGLKQTGDIKHTLKIENNVFLESIYSNSIKISINNQTYQIYLSDKKRVTEVDGVINLDVSLLEILPYLKINQGSINGTIGVYISDRVDGKIIKKLHLKETDLLFNLSGYNVFNLATLSDAYRKLENRKEIVASIYRDGKITKLIARRIDA